MGASLLSYIKKYSMQYKTYNIRYEIMLKYEYRFILKIFECHTNIVFVCVCGCGCGGWEVIWLLIVIYYKIKYNFNILK